MVIALNILFNILCSFTIHNYPNGYVLSHFISFITSYGS